ncbi:hypothetical protein DIPPA_10351 [Diplonema papillatum]|nr:hypothetical protein DIPPA_16916 [Diplonema papillatum]KAJ9436823.1 hypothetical protein DIPPA_05065 [Diplonema papillatum]KAJ9448936.1 hypothetical protein DIPPA_10351 [Diplonema papillatum]
MSGRQYLTGIIHRHMRSRVCSTDIECMKRTEHPLFVKGLCRWEAGYMTFNGVHLERAPSKDAVPSDEEVALHFYRSVFTSPVYRCRRYLLGRGPAELRTTTFQKGEKIGELEVIDRTSDAVIIRPYEAPVLMCLEMVPSYVSQEPYATGYTLRLSSAAQDNKPFSGVHHYVMKKTLQSAAYKMVLESGVPGTGVNLWGYNPWNPEMNATLPDPKR